uniref:DNA repair protein XRCC1 n=1 Tax=Myxine glutinosa TaxID=7769 RepID=UPI003590248F
MQEILASEVALCTSEDHVCKAENLLARDIDKKWKCGSPCGKQASVILQFSKPQQISCIEICNEGSAFVEVLVGKSATPEQDYQVILVMSFFMTPDESRRLNNLNSLRTFDSDKLSKESADGKWEKVKIVCTQPYNKSLKFGLSYIKFYSSFDNEMKMPSLGSSNVRSPVASVKRKSDHSGVSSPSKKKQSTLNFEKTSSPLLKEKSGENKSPQSAKAVKKELGSSPSTASTSATPKPTPQPQEIGDILRGVVFVLSGFQNPFRAEIREKAVSMGAKYMSDWGPNCTHLICAFANTPKYQHVKSQGGCIVRKDWVTACHKKKQKLPTKRYIFVSVGSSSEDEECSEVQKAPAVDEEQDDVNNEQSSDSNGKTHSRKQDVDPQKDPYEGTTDENTDNEAMEMDGIDDSELSIPELPDFFTGKRFLLYGTFPGNEGRMLYRYITAFNGMTEEYMNENVNFVISAQPWDDNFYEALTENPHLAFVKPQWIYSCNKKGRSLPHQPFVVVPQE